MKRYIPILLILAFGTKAFCQEPTKPPAYSKDYYLQKSKHQKTAAWVLFGAGTTMAVIGATTFNSSWDHGSNTDTDVAGFVMLGGVAADIVSIPFFISAAKNKGRAEAAFSYQPVLFPHKGAAIQNIPALVFKIEL